MSNSASREDAKAVVRRNTEEVQGKGNFELFEEIFADDFTFTSPGTFHYFCTIHSEMGMTGSVTVVGTPSPVPGAPAVTQLTPARAGALKRHLTLTVFGRRTSSTCSCKRVAG